MDPALSVALPSARHHPWRPSDNVDASAPSALDDASELSGEEASLMPASTPPSALPPPELPLLLDPDPPLDEDDEEPLLEPEPLLDDELLLVEPEPLLDDELLLVEPDPLLDDDEPPSVSVEFAAPPLDVEHAASWPMVAATARIPSEALFIDDPFFDNGRASSVSTTRATMVKFPARARCRGTARGSMGAVKRRGDCRRRGSGLRP